MWNPETNRITRSRDVQWLDKMYYPDNSIGVREAERYRVNPAAVSFNDDGNVNHFEILDDDSDDDDENDNEDIDGEM